MQFRRTVHGQTDEKLVGRQKFTPFIVQQCAVGLDRIEDGLAAGIFFLQCDCPAEEIHAQQRWLAPLPGEVISGVGWPWIYCRMYSSSTHVAHPPRLSTGYNFLLFEIEAVFAIEIANRADGFRQEMKPVSGIGDGRLAHATQGYFHLEHSAIFQLSRPWSGRELSSRSG